MSYRGRPRYGPSRLCGVHPTELGPKEAEMRIIGCDLHARQQTLAMLDTNTGEVVNKVLQHEGDNVREFYSNLAKPVRVGIEATGSMQWFVNLMEELGIECLVGHPAEIRAAEPRKQKHDRRDADLLLSLLIEERFPTIWLPTKGLLDIRALLRHRHQWVGLRVKIQNALQAIALANGLRRGSSLWTQAGQHTIASLPLSPHAAYRRNELQAMYVKFETEIEKLNHGRYLCRVRCFFRGRRKSPATGGMPALQSYETQYEPPGYLPLRP